MDASLKSVNVGKQAGRELTKSRQFMKAKILAGGVYCCWQKVIIHLKVVIFAHTK